MLSFTGLMLNLGRVSFLFFVPRGWQCLCVGCHWSILSSIASISGTFFFGMVMHHIRCKFHAESLVQKPLKEAMFLVPGPKFLVIQFVTFLGWLSDPLRG